MHFGLFCLNNQREKSWKAGDIFRDTLEHVRLAEDAGFEIAWLAEHHFSNYCLCPSPLTMAAWLAGQTSRIKVGPAVIVAPLYEPVRLLEDIGLVDQLSAGRLVLGFGSGYQEYEFKKFGVEISQARDRLLEVLDLVDGYLKGGALAFDGPRVKMPETWFSVRMAQDRPPLYLAGLADDPEVQRRAASRGYVPFFTTGWSTLDAIVEIRDKAERNWAAGGGTLAEMPFALQRYVFITDSKEAALRAADGARYVRRIGMAMRNKYGVLEGAFLKEIPAADEPPLEELAERLLIGDPDTVAERLAREIDVLGLTHVSCFMAIPGLSQSVIMRSIERFGSEVMPRLERRFGDLRKLVPNRHAVAV